MTEAIKATPAHLEQIRLLSERELYQQAATFVAENKGVFRDKQVNHQLNGLLNASRSWADLNNFVNNQIKRVWTGRKEDYGTFYNNLKQQLAALAALATEQFVANATLTKNQVKEQTAVYAGLLAREFIQHLFAEMVWQKEVRQ